MGGSPIFEGGSGQHFKSFDPLCSGLPTFEGGFGERFVRILSASAAVCVVSGPAQGAYLR